MRFSIINNNITYHKEENYFIPNLYLSIQHKKQIGKYGRLRLNYLKDFIYTKLFIDGTLKQHFLDIDNRFNERVYILIKQSAEFENINEIIYV